MHETPLATSSPVRSKIPVRGRRKAKNSRRSVSLLDVSAIDAKPDASSRISESNETLASGYKDSGYVRSEASSLEEDDSKASKDLVEELKFKDVLICELQESNRGLRMRCADAENKIWRLRVKCQSHCACCQVKETEASPAESADEDRHEASNEKYDFLSHHLFQFKPGYPFSTSAHDLSSSGSDRLSCAQGSLANSFTAGVNFSRQTASKKPLSRSKSSGTIGTQTALHRSHRRNDDQAEKLFAMKVQQWQKERVLKRGVADEIPSDRRKLEPRNPADGCTDSSVSPSTAAYSLLLNKTPVQHKALGLLGTADDESLLSVISERDNSLEVEPRMLNVAWDSPEQSSTNSFSQPRPFADLTNRASPVSGTKHQVPKYPRSLLRHVSPLSSDHGFHADGDQDTLKRPVWSNTKFAEAVSGPPESSKRLDEYGRFPADEQPCSHCKCARPSPVIIVPTGCCSCCKTSHNKTSADADHWCHTEDPTSNHDQSKMDAATDSSDLHPIFEMKSKATSAAGKFNFSSSEFDTKIEHQAACQSSDRDCKCSPNCSGLTVPLAPRFDAKAEYKRKIEEGMKKFASDARAEMESLSFQPWTSSDSEMSPLMKRLAESSHYVNQMAITINRLSNSFHRVTGTPNPVNPSP